ncbi:polymorphic toxin-type HINT domain-containing protein [Streptomyces sp. LUP47B]|uniref:polymorphic toxin-type HINT domain-containing protein n=1 Tax=Streptomyces sp. LUP47B TaxID=1890286 RepID=UPI00114CD55D|nr:polymorphic toxin-type HINT domain-containing protein [Streptomyces sp. LUP47B]
MTARARTGILRRVALTVSAVLVGTLIQATVAEPAVAEVKLPTSEKQLSGHGVKPTPRRTDGKPRVPKTAPKRAWPKAGSATVTLLDGARATTLQAGDLPVSLTAPQAKTSKLSAGRALTGKATVRVLDRKTTELAGVDGLLFSIRTQAGADGDALAVSVDYSKFAQAYGGAYAARLKLVRLPACAATHPGTAKCSKAETVPSHNDVEAKTLTADAVALSTAGSSSATTLLAATTGTSSDQGDYKASQLSASSAWQTNLNTGDFTWSYDMPVPDVPGSFTPQVGLSYSSGSLDGRTSNTNNQGSWAGDGFDLWPGFIERSYKGCADDGVKNADGTKPGDLCWAYDNATLSFNGHSGELIATGTNSFRIKGDDGTKVDRIYGADTSGDVRGNGARKDEYWRVTTTDGTRYYFGYNRLPGWASGNSATNSAWSAPVFGNDDGEACHAATFADSWCQQGWRWNLDYAVDTHGNAIAYYYNKETNYYARNLKSADKTVYDRGGYLDHIEYGLKSSSVYSAKALARVDFTSAERCLPETGVTCDASTIDDKKFYWYDTPWDLNCKSGADCYNASPSFWTRKRLTGLTTSVVKSDGSYAPVDSWTFGHRWGTADIDYQLLLTSIQHTGKSTTPEITLPKVTFDYDQRTNRLKIDGDNTSPFIKERLSTIADETGGQTDVTYSTAVCDASNLPTPETNKTRCFPTYFTKEGDADPTLQWFNKYVVDAVTQTDRTKSSPDMVTRYDYLDGAAWHYDDDDGLTKQKYKTWSTWRGYAHVRVRTGGQDPVGMKSQTDHYFLRGMDGDRAAPSGGTKSASVSDDNGGTITDHDSAAGFEYKAESYSGPDGKVLGKTVNTPWHHQTASRTRNWGTTTANLTGTANTRTWTSLDDGAGSKWRTTYQTNTFEDTAGRIVRTDDFGDESTSTDNQCTRTTYVDNTTDWILDPPSRVETVAVKCADTPDRSKDVIVDIRTAYDGQNYGSAPTVGDATSTATLKSHDGTTATYIEAGAKYDTYGRQTSGTDITGTVTAAESTAPVRADRTGGLVTTTAYAPTTGFPTSSTITVTPASVTGNTATAQTTKTTYDTVRGLPLAVSDTNTKSTETTYDALGRKLKVWLPNRSKANNDTPNYQFSYTITDGKPVAVGTTTLYGTGRKTAYTLYDGFLRPRQVQAPGPDGGRLISDTFYDERGLTAKAFTSYYNTQAPSTDLLALDDALAVETQTWNSYDGLGRVTKSQQIAGNGDGGAVLSTTVSAYGGDRVTVTPPKGATPTTTVTDARGRTTELWQYHGATPTGFVDKTLYSYNPAGKLTKLTDPAGSTWTYDYDQRGNQKLAIDPDKGTVTSGYDDRNQLVLTTDNRGKKITHLYDGLGRETETHEGDASGPLMTKRVWDPSGFKGQRASATRYIGGESGSAYTTTYSMYDTLYRPHRTTITIPDSEGTGLKGSYQTNVQYNVDDTVQSVGYPAAGSLTAEAVTPTYDDVLRPKTLSGSGGLTYVTDTVYSYTGKPLQYSYQAAGAKKTQVTNTYQWGTQRLQNSRVDRQDVSGTDKSATYGYDEAGNITSLSDVSRDGTDNQCFTYDYLGRLSDAWAQNTTTCAATPSASVLGGPAPYWQSYTYDLSGNRLTETQHDATGDTSKDIKRGYTYPPAGGKRPHGLTQVDTTGPNGISQDTYSYDDAGNTQTRTLSGDKQTLLWDAEGHLVQVTKPDGSGGTKSTSYVYDADGNRLITRTDADTTLYLGGTQIVLANGSTTPKATRYYDLGGGNQAIRTDDNKLSFLIGDHHGTSELAINGTDLTLQQRRSTPFGAARGKAPTSWPGDKGFIGGIKDTSTGLTHLGARDYDPTTGRFLSADPVLNAGDPQQINGYSYSNNSPVTRSDPTGLESCGASNPGCSQDNIDSINHTGPYKDTNGSNNTTNTGGHGKPGVKTAKDGQPIIQGIRLPTKKELVARYAVLDPRRTSYSQYLARFATDQCHTRNDKNAGFCDTAARAGLLPGPQNDPWGVKATIHCVTGRGDCGEAAVSGVITLVTLAWGSFGKGLLARGASRAVVAEAEEGTVATLARLACSFTPSTPVLLKDGKTKPIGKVKPGDQVAAADPRTGKRRGSRTVTARIVHNDNDLVEVTVRGTDGQSATLHATANHPFWDETDQSWIPAGNLEPGHVLNTATNRHVLVIGVETRPGRADMYNLTVEQLHTYYVLAGVTPVLVHNSNNNCNLFNGGGWQHVLDEHVDGSPGVVQGNTTFSNYADLDEIGELIEDTAKTPGRPNTPDAVGRPRDGTIHTHDFGYPVGSRGETSVEVVLNPDGSLRTAYPR